MTLMKLDVQKDSLPLVDIVNGNEIRRNGDGVSCSVYRDGVGWWFLEAPEAQARYIAERADIVWIKMLNRVERRYQ